MYLQFAYDVSNIQEKILQSMLMPKRIKTIIVLHSINHEDGQKWIMALLTLIYEHMEVWVWVCVITIDILMYGLSGQWEIRSRPNLHLCRSGRHGEVNKNSQWTSWCRSGWHRCWSGRLGLLLYIHSWLACDVLIMGKHVVKHTYVQMNSNNHIITLNNHKDGPKMDHGIFVQSEIKILNMLLKGLRMSNFKKMKYTRLV